MQVLITFPAEFDAGQLARVEAATRGIEVAVEAYGETTERRNARSRGRGDEYPAPELTDAQRTAFRGADVILAWDLPIDIGALAPDLAWVQAISAGVDHLEDSRRDGVTITTAAGVAAGPIAEFVMARMLAEWKRLEVIEARQRDHEWRPAYGRVVEGRTLVLVGLGAIGTAIAARAGAFGMRVVAVRRNPDAPTTVPIDAVHPPEALHQALAEGDAVVVCAPASPGTEGLFDAAAFAAMAPGAWFCNVARGSLVVEDALVDALASGHLAAAALDVTRQEPLPEDSPLWDVPGLHISPHSAASLDRYVDSLVDLFVDNLGRYGRGEPLRNVVT